MGRIHDELRCGGCGVKLGKGQPLFDTGWTDVYWCGSARCAHAIMEGNCEEMDPDDPGNQEGETG